MLTSPTSPANTPGEPSLPVFDADVLGALFNHDRAILTSVLQTFASTTGASLGELPAAAAAQDLAAIAALAHKVTGASRLSGFRALGDAAHGVEKAAKQGNWAATQAGLAVLDTQWQRAQAAIAAWNR